MHESQWCQKIAKKGFTGVSRNWIQFSVFNVYKVTVLCASDYKILGDNFSLKKCFNIFQIFIYFFVG